MRSIYPHCKSKLSFGRVVSSCTDIRGNVYTTGFKCGQITPISKCLCWGGFRSASVGIVVCLATASNALYNWCRLGFFISSFFHWNSFHFRAWNAWLVCLRLPSCSSISSQFCWGNYYNVFWSLGALFVNDVGGGRGGLTHMRTRRTRKTLSFTK